MTDTNLLDNDKRGGPKASVAKSEESKPVRLLMALPESCAQFADHDEPRFLVKVPERVAYEDLFAPITWKNIRAKYAPVGKSLAGSLLICKDDRGTYRAVLEVRLDGPWGMVVEEIQKHTYKVAAVSPESPADFKVEFLSANRGWGVVRKSDNQVIAQAGDEAGARQRLDQHLRMIA